jgi:hypothetical protein
LAFFSGQIFEHFSNRARGLSEDINDSWQEYSSKVKPDEIHVLSSLLGILEALIPIVPITAFFRGMLEGLLQKAIEVDVSRRESALKAIHKIVAVLKGLSAVMGFLNLLGTAIAVIASIYVYVWLIYPNIPQSFGGGAPTQIQLVVSVEKIAPELYDVIGIDQHERGSSKSAITDELLLLYTTSDQYYVRAGKNVHLSISKSAVEGAVWSEF